MGRNFHSIKKSNRKIKENEIHTQKRENERTEGKINERENKLQTHLAIKEKGKTRKSPI